MLSALRKGEAARLKARADEANALRVCKEYLPRTKIVRLTTIILIKVRSLSRNGSGAFKSLR